MASSSYRSHLSPLSSLSSSPFSSAAAPSVPVPPQQQQQHHLFDLDLTIVSAKHLKNVNWRNGELKPYAVFWLDPDRKLATKPDDFGSTRPVWNERFTLPLPLSSSSSSPQSQSTALALALLEDLVLTLEIFHSKPSETPKPLVASLRCPLNELFTLPLPLPDDDPNNHHRPNQQRIRTLELHRPSGRPQGKIRLKVSLRERPLPPPPPHHDYRHLTPPHTPPPPPVPSAYYYSTAPPPLPPASSRDYHRGGIAGGGGGAFSPSPYGNPLPPHHPSHYPYASYADPYAGYYPGYYSPPPPPPRPFFDRASGYGGPGGPSAPVDFSVPPASLYEQKPKGSMMGLGTGVAVGALAGAIGGLALEEGLKYEEDKITSERDLASRDDYSDYRAEY